MEKIPEISVVIGAYNKEKYIGETIQSVLVQTFQDFEIIVVDDGSSDNTKEVVSSFCDGRIKYYYQDNSGLPACGRNKGMMLARGRYIALLDGDDFWQEEKLQKCKKALDEIRDVDLVCHNEAIIHNGKIVRRTSYGPYVDNMYHKLLFGGNCLHTSAVVMRRKVVFDDGFKFSEEKNLLAIEDYEYWLRLSKRYRFYFLPEMLGYYRVTDTGAYLSSGESNVANLLSLLDSHFDKIIEGKSRGIRNVIRRRRSYVMGAGGRIYQHKGNFKECKRWYLKAIAEYPLNYKAYVGFLAAVLGIRIIYR